jgi:hypothetical protein
MAQRLITDCDKCGDKNVSTKNFYLRLDRRWDGVENSDIGIKFDLCSKCMSQVIQTYFNNMSFLEAETWLKKSNSLSKLDKRNPI